MGSDVAGIRCRATADGDDFVLNGTKYWITNGGVADICLIFCRTDPDAGRRGISVVVAERGAAGFVVGDLEDLCGMRANPVCSIRLYDCRLPANHLLATEGMGLKIGLAALDTGRMGIGAQAVGIAQAALEESVRYARQRQQFGVPIERHQAIQTMLADMATQVDAARLLVYRAAALKDKHLSFSKESAMAKLFASEAANQVTDLAVHRQDLIVATQGRSFWILDDLTPLRALTQEVLDSKFALLPSRDAVMVLNSPSFGFGGDDEFVGRNPPAAASIASRLPGWMATNAVATSCREVTSMAVSRSISRSRGFADLSWWSALRAASRFLQHDHSFAEQQQSENETST